MATPRKLGFLMALVFLTPMLAGCTDLLSNNSPPTATINVDPSGTVKTGESVTFNAAGSSDPDGDSMTLEWRF